VSVNQVESARRAASMTRTRHHAVDHRIGAWAAVAHALERGQGCRGTSRSYGESNRVHPGVAVERQTSRLSIRRLPTRHPSAVAPLVHAKLLCARRACRVEYGSTRTIAPCRRRRRCCRRASRRELTLETGPWPPYNFTTSRSTAPAARDLEVVGTWRSSPRSWSP